MLRIEARGTESKFWRYASPILALVLTGATSGLIFAAMGRPPGLTVYTFLIAPLLQQDGFAAGQLIQIPGLVPGQTIPGLDVYSNRSGATVVIHAVELYALAE